MSNPWDKKIIGSDTYEAREQRSNLPKYLGGLIGFLSFPGVFVRVIGGVVFAKLADEAAGVYYETYASMRYFAAHESRIGQKFINELEQAYDDAGVPSRRSSGNS